MTNTRINSQNVTPQFREVEYTPLMDQPGNGNFLLNNKTRFNGDILELSCVLSTGTCDLSIDIDQGSGWVAVTSIDGVSCTSVRRSYIATALRSFGENDKIRLRVANGSDPGQLSINLLCREAIL